MTNDRYPVSFLRRVRRMSTDTHLLVVSGVAVAAWWSVTRLTDPVHIARRRAKRERRRHRSRWYTRPPS